MKNRDQHHMKGRLRIQMTDRSGKLVKDFKADNAIVETGRMLVAEQFVLSSPPNQISHLAVGTGTTPVDPGDTALESELTPRKAIATIDPTRDITITSDNKVRLLVTAELDFAEANGALTEAGLFNAATGGVMYNRVQFPVVNKTNAFKLTLIWEILF